MNEIRVNKMKELMALDEVQFKKLYEGPLESADVASKQRDDRTVLVIAHNHRQFQIMRQREGIKNAIYISCGDDFRGRLDPLMFRLVLCEGYHGNRRVTESYGFEEAIKRLDVSEWKL